MKLLDKINKGILGDIFTPTTPIEKWGGSYFYGEKIALTLWDKKTIEWFLNVPEVNAILNYRAKAKQNVKLRVVSKITGEDANSAQAGQIRNLLKYPNYFQAQKEFIRQSSLFHDIDGNEYIFAFKGENMAPTSSKALFTLPPQYITPKLKNPDYWFFITEPDIEYIMKIRGKEVKLPPSNIIHLNDNKVDVKENNILQGSSKLEANRAAINNIIAAYEARNVFLTKRGALGILSNASKDGMGGTVPLDADEKEKLQAEFRQYGVMADQYHTIITNMALDWQQMGVDIEKLRVFEEVREDFFKLCDAYGVPKDMFAHERNSTFTNQEKAEKRFYENTIIPEMHEWIGALNAFFDTENRSWEITGDFSHLPFFQVNELDRSKTNQNVVNYLSKLLEDSAISLNEYQSELRRLGVIQ
jgi:phage portal protein BeeE